MKRILAIGLAGLAVAGLGAALLLSGGDAPNARPDRADMLESLPPLETVLPPVDGGERGAGENGRPDARPVSVESATGADGEPAGPGDIVFSRLQINTDADTPEACLVFSGDLAADGDVRFEDYLEITPETKPALRVNGPLLCLGGLSFGERYQVTIREGLPGTAGAKTPFDETVPVELRDRPAAISFGSGLILPRETSDGVPITTVNVERLKIRVLRVGDRLLSQLREGLLDERSLYPWRVDQVEREQGTVVWTGEMAVAADRNQTVRTLFPIREALARTEEGVYLILAEDGADAEDDRYSRTSAAQWVIESDLALTTFSGQDGLRVFVRSLSKATPVKDAEIVLLARNNEILGRATANEDGAVNFDPGISRGEGGSAPAMVLARHNKDFMFLDLRRASFDLSDRGVGGRPAPGAMDAFVYLDRGIYRPGETVQIVSLLRTDRAQAIEDVPLTTIVRRPDGIEYRRITASQAVAGAFHVPVTLSRSAVRGPWTVSVHLDPRRPALGSATFDVQDFVPERLEISVEPPERVLKPGDDVRIDVSARYLYDAPAKGLDGEASIRIVADPEPYADHKDFSFGLVEEAFSPVRQELAIEPTDDSGATQVSGVLEGLEDVTRPLRGDVTVAVFEPGGRLTRERVSLPIRPVDTYLGIRPDFDGGVVRLRTPAGFDLVALDRAGTAIAAKRVDWQLIREVINYQWYQVGDDWRYERIVRDRPLQAGAVDLAADTGARVEINGLDWGSYRLAVRDPQTGAASSVRFWAGWYGGGGDQRPDRVTVTLDKPLYKAGETAKVTIRPPMGGKALVTFAGARVHDTRLIDLPADGRTIDVPVGADWGSGAYVIVNAYRPLLGDESRVPVRAIGLAHVAVDQSERTLTVDFDIPDVVAPQMDVTVPVRVARASGGRVPGTAYVTLAAVDTGILNLTDFDAPAPEDHYFGKRRLAVEIRDDYGRLIRGARGAAGEIRSGGDGFGDAGGLNVVPTRTVALFSGIVSLDEEGTAAIPLTIPDFVGELKVMAVAFSRSAVGHGTRPVTVRREVVGDLALPRFLAPGDTADATLQINNVEGPSGQYEALITTAGALGDVATERKGDDLRLDTGEDRRVPVPLSADRPGRAEVALDVTGPGDLAFTRTWPIQVRAPRLPRVDRVAGVLEPGTALDYDAGLLVDFYPDTAAFSVSLSAAPVIDVPGLLRALDRYPYGCLEQTTSRAFPLLYFNDLAAASGVAADEDLDARLQDAVDKVLDLQRPDGAFGMWSRGGGEANLWLSVFALDFIAVARAQGLVVPADAVMRGQNWLGNLARANWQDSDARAYAFFVLARGGRARISDLRYFFDTKRGELKSAMGLALLGGALDAVGDKARGRIAFAEAVERVTTAAGPRDYAAIPYGSLRRDLAGVTALVAQSRRLTLLPALFEKRDELGRPDRDATTQEMVWLLLTAHYLRETREATPLSVVVDGTEPRLEGDLMILTPSDAELVEGIALRNTGDVPLWYVATAEGVPTAAEAPVATGLSVTKTLLTLDGDPVDPASLKQSDRYVVLVRGQMNRNRFREMALLDLLPAGFEIESVLPGGDSTQYPWLPKLSFTQLASARDDRFVAAFNVGSRYRPRPRRGEKPKVIRPEFALAYVVRAVTPGRFTLPAARVEDMYAPRILARTDEGTVTIAPSRSE